MAGNSQRRGAVRKEQEGPTRSAPAASAVAASRARARRRRPRTAPHHAGKRKAARSATRHRRGVRPAAGAAAARHPRAKKATSEMVTGRNSVLEALRAKIPATALYIAGRIDSTTASRRR